ncbi:Peroxidase 52 [Linum perenne]
MIHYYNPNASWIHLHLNLTLHAFFPPPCILLFFYINPTLSLPIVFINPNILLIFIASSPSKLESMAYSFAKSSFVTLFIIVSVLSPSGDAQLAGNFYARTCPNVQGIVRGAMREAVNREPRLGASIMRLFFHDCFVNGCDGSVLLDDTTTFTGEKNANANRNSVRGFEVIDTIKTRVERACSGTVSCADILAIAARDGVVLLGGPSWQVLLGRRDARTASQSTANTDLPSPFADLPALISSFTNKGLTAADMTVLSGGHTVGQASIYNETNIGPNFATTRRANCPAATGTGDANLAPLDFSPNRFDNAYYRELVAQRGLLHSDQQLFSGGSQDALVRTYSTNVNAFARDFANAMIRMGNLSPLTGANGEIRLNCRIIN